jgi:hypothetical protein
MILIALRAQGVEIAEVHLSRSDKMHGPASPCFSIKVLAVEFSVPVFTGIVIIATGEFDEHARLIAHGPRIVTRWQQHHIVL